MKGSQILLLLTGSMLAIAGLIYLYNPAIMYSFYKEPISDVTQYHLARGGFGGVLFVTGAAAVAGAFIKSFRHAALWITVIYLGGIGFGRVVSLLADGFPPVLFLSISPLIELSFAGLALYFIRKGKEGKISGRK